MSTEWGYRFEVDHPQGRVYRYPTRADAEDAVAELAEMGREAELVRREIGSWHGAVTADNVERRQW